MFQPSSAVKDWICFPLASQRYVTVEESHAVPRIHTKMFDDISNPLDISSVLVGSLLLRAKFKLTQRSKHIILPPSPPISSPDIANFRWVDVIGPQVREKSVSFPILDILHTEETSWCGFFLQGVSFGGRRPLASWSIPELPVVLLHSKAEKWYLPTISHGRGGVLGPRWDSVAGGFATIGLEDGGGGGYGLLNGI
ncbi:hypothetical protein DFH07DRAFT_831768 [Mycena maculata]|uniref:Uncharacterized protein n=1 Tax=Mycena maculata TaxID=230809 RepID=A0AAD7IQU6_9AGAR|nr:hypothetical protein DFH07DRAFT_831768 [Mycena maculata]